jgi:hypothetical protein
MNTPTTYTDPRRHISSPDSAIDRLSPKALRNLCARYLYAVAEGDDADEAEVRALRFTVRDGYERDLVPGDVILGCAFDEAYPE